MSQPAGLLPRLLSFVSICWFVAAIQGCALLDKCTCIMPKETPEPVSNLETIFEPVVHFVDDTQNPGNMVPGLSGRLWLFTGDGSKAVRARGKVEAALYDLTPVAAGGLPTKVAEWDFDAVSLKMLEREDKLGLGYSMFLPLMEYRADMKKVQLRFTYIDHDGAKRASVPMTLNLRAEQDTTQVNMQEYKGVPASSLPRRK